MAKIAEPERNKRGKIKRRAIVGEFKKELEAMHGKCCVNCGSSENVNWHHIVPLVNGGKDTPENMIPLCERCHAATHKFNKKSLCGRKGRMPKVTMDKAAPIFQLYVDREVDRKTAAKWLGYSDNVNITDIKAFQTWCKENGIQKGTKNWGAPKHGEITLHAREVYAKLTEETKHDLVENAEEEPKEKAISSDWGTARKQLYWIRLSAGLTCHAVKMAMGDDITTAMIDGWEQGIEEPSEEQKRRLVKVLRINKEV